MAVGATSPSLAMLDPNVTCAHVGGGAKKRKRAPKSHVVHGDCVEGMRKLPANSVHLVLADPPYGVNQARWDGAKGYMHFAHAWLEQAERVLCPGGALLVFASPCAIWASRMNVHLEDTLKMKHKQTLTWCYAQGELSAPTTQYATHARARQRVRVR